MWNAYLVELHKAVRMRITCMGPLLVLAAVCSTMLQIPLQKDGVSDYRFIAAATTISIDMLGLLLIVIFCAGLISSELGRGTVRTVLVRPLRRIEFLLAKLLLGFTFAWSLLLLAGAASWSLALLLGDVHGVEFGGELLYSSAEMAVTYLLAAGISAVLLSSVVAYALLFSAATRSPATAIGWAVGLWLLLGIVKYPLGIDAFMFSTYLASPWEVFANRSDGLVVAWMPGAAYWVLVSLISSAVFVVGAAAIFQRRSLHA